MSGADQARPRTSTIGIASSAWPINSPAAAAISSAKPVSVTSNSRPKRSGWPRRSTNAGSPAAPSATPTVPLRQGRPKLSLMMTPMPTPKTSIRCCRKACAEPSGSTGNSSTRSRAVLRRDVRVVDAGIGHHETEAMLDDQQTRAMADHPLRFGQHHLDKARVLVDLGGECDRALRRPHGRDIDITSLGLGDDLLRHDQHIAVFRDEAIVPQRGDGNRTEIVARLDQLDAGERE